MVILLRHGSIKLDNKPCRRNLKCTNALRTSDTSSQIPEASETSPNIVALDSTICPQITSNPPRIPTVDAITINAASLHLYDTPSVTFTTSASEGTATIYSSTKDNALTTTLVSHWPELDTLASLPYLERPVSSRTSLPSTHSLSTPFSSLPSFLPDSLPLSRVVGYNKNWRVLVLYVIFSMFLLCKGCFCVNCEPGYSSPRNNISWDLSILNESKVGAMSDLSGQCLIGTGNYSTSICKKKTTKDERMQTLRDTYTNFCGLPFVSILSETEKDIVTTCGPDKGCKRVIESINDVESQLHGLYCSFLDIMGRMDCTDSYSQVGNCNTCRDAYKRWLCSLYIDYYIEGQKIQPCIDFCDQVSKSCPFFRAQGASQGESLIGEPGFLCKDTNIQHKPADPIYGEEGCCVKPCQMFQMTHDEGPCPSVNLTSNCTNTTNNASVFASPTSSHVLHLLVCIVVSRVLVLQTFMNQFTCIGYT